MKKILSNSYLNIFFVLTLSLFTEELIFRIISDSHVFTFGTVRILVETIIISSLLTFIINLFKHSIAKKIAMGIIIFAGAFYTGCQLVFNSFIWGYAS